MCILIASTAHPEYPLIILSNRDEFYDRPTQRADFWPAGHDGVRVLAPLDMAREEHGTWIGISTSGRLAVLLNCHEESREKAISKISRGLFPKEFLTSTLPTQQWVDYTIEKFGQAGLADAGGFTMLCGIIESDKKSRAEQNCENKNIAQQNGNYVEPSGKYAIQGPFTLFSNRNNDTVCILDKGKHYLCVSNGMNDDTWVKTEIGEDLLETAIKDSVDQKWDYSTLVDHLFGILSTDTYPHEDPSVYNVRKSVFIPEIKLRNDSYGTRTQTVILVDKHRKVTYLERNLGDPKTHRHEFSIVNV